MISPIYIMFTANSILQKIEYPFPEIWGPFKNNEDADAFMKFMKEQGCKGEFATCNANGVYKSDGTLDLEPWK